MKISQIVLTSVVSSLVIVAMMLAFWSLGGMVAAQKPTPGSGDATFRTATPLPPNGDGQLASESSRKPPMPETGPDAANQLNLSFSYYKVIGTTFQPRMSTSTYSYTSNGCMYQNGGTDLRFQAPLVLPEGSEIKYVRIYFQDTVAQDMTVWLTSSGSGGYGTALSTLITQTVDMASYAYVLTWGTGTTTSGNQICGVRVAYYAPSIFGAFLPLIRKK